VQAQPHSAHSQLALKHRKNKNGSKRIIVFVGSPITDAAIKLKKLAAQLKKNNVSSRAWRVAFRLGNAMAILQIDLDIISMGENADNAESLEIMVKAAGENSHLVDIPAGVYPTEVLASSAIVGGSAGGGGGAAGFGGVDGDMDPEFAMAMQASLAEARAAAGGGGEGAGPGTGGGDDNLTEDDMLARAMALSMMESTGPTAAAPVSDEVASMDVAPQTTSDGISTPGGGGTAASTSSEAPAAAASHTEAGAATATTAVISEESGAVQDPDFMASLLAGLPGVDVNDPSIQAALAGMSGSAAASKQAEEGDKSDEDAPNK
jgi:26S proteasome regulatory subunit N10